MNPRRQRVFLFVLFLPVLLFSQYDDRLGKAPFRKTFNTQSLAHALTDSLPNDSLKVRSIYLWMATHIDYDMYGFVSGRGSYEHPRSILIHRKAVCLGYSILFDSLCAAAGIEAEVVLGYVYLPWYEARDTFYLDQHAWNAVLIDGEWKLIDVTWGCGSIKLRKQRLHKLYCRIFQLPCPPRYKYIHKVNDHYFFTPPEQMILDHLPATPAWQLLDCYVPIDSFQRSPQATQHYLDDPVNCRSSEDSIARIVASFEHKRMVVSGKQAVAFNKHNHQDISYGAWVYASHLIDRSRDTSLSEEVRVQYCDSTMRMMDSLVRYYRASAKDSRDEGRYFLRRNRRMKQQVENETRPLLRAHGGQRSVVRRERYLALRQIRMLRMENRRLRRDSRHIRKRNVKVMRPPNPVEKQNDQRIDLETKYEANTTDAETHIANMNSCSCFNYSDEGPRYDTLLAEQRRRVKIEFHDMKTVNFYKMTGYSCYDTLVFSPKNEVLLVHQQEDSLQKLIRPVGHWEMDSAGKVCDLEANQAKDLLRRNMTLLNQLSRLPAGSLDEKAELALVKKQYKAINDSLIHSNKAEIDDLKQYYRGMRRMRWQHWRVEYLLRMELHREKWRYAGDAKFFSTYYRGISIMFQRNIQFAAKVRSDARQRKNKLQREIRKKQREEKK